MKKALVVGVDVYRNPSWNLYGCVADAVSISSLLENTYQFKRKNIRVVTNERATKQGILSRLTWLLSEVTAGDTVVFYYAGHGSRIRDRDGDELRDHLDECLVPHDHDWDNALTDDILSEYLQKVPQGCECIVIFDCCLDKDTIIPLLDGTKPTIEELSKRDDEFWVYADNGEGQVIPAKAHSARITGQRTLYEVILDTGETFRCTYDHELLMRDGTYKQLCDIQVGESLMPFNTRVGTSSYGYYNGYEFVYNNIQMKWLPTHIMVRDFFNLLQDKEKRICHHINYNKLDNRPENLEMMTWSRHKQSHGEVGRRNLKKMWSNPEYMAWRNSDEYKELCSKSMKKRWSTSSFRKKMQRAASNRDNSQHTKRLVSYNKDSEMQKKQRAWQKTERGKRILQNQCCEMNGNAEIRTRQMQGKILNVVKKCKTLAEFNNLRFRGCPKLEDVSKYFPKGSDLMQLAQDYNHRIVSVTQIEGIHDVYDLTVDTYHNFAIDSGIFVHNCNSGTGTRNVDMSSRETRVRYLPPPADILERSRNSCLETRSFGKVVHTENHILLSACKNDQEAKEIKIRGKSRGVFTYSLEKELIQMPRFSYRELIERVGQSIKEQGVSDQDPQLESPQDRMGLTVFGQTTYSTESHSDEEFLGVVREYFRRFPELKKALHWLFSQDPRYLERLL